MSTEVDGEERPQCVLCMKVLASECMLPSNLKHHLETTHPSLVSKSHDYFSRKLKELNQQMGSFYKQASIPSSALLASYKVDIESQNVRNPIQSQRNSFYRLL
jgi:hypothetical protein